MTSERELITQPCRYAVFFQHSRFGEIVHVLHGLVPTLEDASALFCAYRDRHDLGSELPGARVFETEDGQEVARVSPNGKVWPPGEWTPGLVPLYDPLMDSPRLRTIKQIVRLSGRFFPGLEFYDRVFRHSFGVLDGEPA